MRVASVIRKSLVVATVGVFILSAGMVTSALAVPMTFDLTGVVFSDLKANVLFGYTAGTGTIAIDITNTSLPGAGPDPRLTGFAFNAPSNVTGSSFSGPSGWTASFDPNNINTPGQFGQFDVAGLTGPDFTGGSPNSGIPVGNTFHFEFVLTGSGLGSLNEMSFLSLLSFEDPPPNEAEQYFIGRFQRVGANELDSDVAIPGGDPTPVPEPATLLLLGSGLAGLGFVGRKRMTKRDQE